MSRSCRRTGAQTATGTRMKVSFRDGVSRPRPRSRTVSAWNWKWLSCRGPRRNSNGWPALAGVAHRLIGMLLPCPRSRAALRHAAAVRRRPLRPPTGSPPRRTSYRSREIVSAVPNVVAPPRPGAYLSHPTEAAHVATASEATSQGVGVEQGQDAAPPGLVIGVVRGEKGGCPVQLSAPDLGDAEVGVDRQLVEGGVGDVHPDHQVGRGIGRRVVLRDVEDEALLANGEARVGLEPLLQRGTPIRGTPKRRRSNRSVLES